MNLNDVSILRLVTQQISSKKFNNVKNIVAWMCAMQAQDYAMVKWAIGIRLPKSTEKLVRDAINKGEIIRTHLLRPTWHFVSADDISWILDLTAPKIIASLKHRQRYLGISPMILSRSNKIISKALLDRNSLTREEIKTELGKAKIQTDNNRLTHLLVSAELNGIICGGPEKDNKQTYALFSERVPNKQNLTKDESLAELAKRYFTSHSPASIQDFSWWSGLSLTNARHGLEMVKSKFISETINSTTYWFPNSYSIPNNYKILTYLLPAYDEFIISYKDRRAAMELQHHKKVISNNGIFYPLIVSNGKVIGSWTRIIKNDKVSLNMKLFQPVDNKIKKTIDHEAEKFGKFIGKKIEIKYTSI
jgi:DNA glycosylase AlkZ-like